MRKNLEKIKKNILRKAGGYAYYFDEEGVYRKVTIEEVAKLNLLNVHMLGKGDFWYDEYKIRILICENYIVSVKTICKLKEGDTLDKLAYYIENTKIESHKKAEGLDRFITRIERPRFERVPENTNKNTFDFIYIDVNIVSTWEEDRKQYIKNNMDKIYKRITQKLESSKTFNKYGVTTNFLKIARVTLKNDSVLQFVLELKIR